MFRCLAALFLVCGVAATAGETVLVKTEFKPGAPVLKYTVKECEIKTSIADGGVYRIEVVRNDLDAKSYDKIQVWINYGGGLEAGKTYRAEVTIKANQAAEALSQVLLTNAPYTSIGARSYKLEADKPVKATVTFTPKETLAGTYRTPCLMLGKAEAGTVFELTDAALIVDAEPETK